MTGRKLEVLDTPTLGALVGLQADLDNLIGYATSAFSTSAVEGATPEEIGQDESATLVLFYLARASQELQTFTSHVRSMRDASILNPVPPSGTLGTVSHEPEQ